MADTEPSCPNVDQHTEIPEELILKACSAAYGGAWAFSDERYLMQRALAAALPEHEKQLRAERDRLEAELTELANAELGEALNHSDKCPAVAERDALKAELAEARAAIEQAREGLTNALAAWKPEHDYYQDRAERKGYTHDETAAEVYGDAIRAVTDALAALDAPQRPEDTREETGDADA